MHRSAGIVGGFPKIAYRALNIKKKNDCIIIYFY